ncbi:MAG: GGDEF domain-containing protein [Spirochaetaceae bacterium]|jgi:diguanylate cyclase (GGDEF)-like protein|nr:GGDEF domain-containing protein [Spirochaetaceae bacterium]
MQLTPALNIIAGPALLIVLILIDYTRKYITDTFQLSIFFKLSVFVLTSMTMNFLYHLFEGLPGPGMYWFFQIIIMLQYFVQILVYYYMFLFINYNVFKNPQRAKFLAKTAWFIAAVYALILVLNLKWRFYYILTPDHAVIPGRLYIIRFLFSYSPILFVLYDCVVSFQSFKKSQLFLLLSFISFPCIGSSLDMIFHSGSLMLWPSLSGSLLYAYFFIIRSDSKLDSLTGLGNRYSFNEFISKLSNSHPGLLSRKKTKSRRFRRRLQESYSIVMIDMDHFKEINDTLGHLEGDNALRDMAAVIKGSIRQSDFAARYGGDEFVLAAKAEYDMTKLMDRIQKALDELNKKNRRPYKLEISYGCDVYTTNSDQSIEEFLKHIDSLMYKYKNERRRSTDRGHA